MPRFIRTARAEDDLIDIWLSIAVSNEEAADALLDRIDGVCAQLADFPKLGPARSDLFPGLRYMVVGHYLIFYRIVSAGVEIVRIVHGARHLPDVVGG